MKPIDYSQTIMYKLVPKDLNSDLVYVGHTTNFRQRKWCHKTSCCNTSEKNSKYNRKVYVMIRANGGWDKWQMIQIEVYPCQNKREAEKRERELMEEFNANLNMIKSFCTKEDNFKRDSVKEKEYREKNKNILLPKRKKYYQKNRDVLIAKAILRANTNKDVKLARRRELRQQKKLEALKLEENSVGV